MRAEEAYSGNVFIAAKADLEEARAVIYGMPMGWTASFRPGSRFGPRRIREVSLVLEEYSPHLGRELGEVPFYDAGDIPLPFGNPGRSLEKIGRFVAEVLQRDKMPIGLGGEHLVTWPVVREVYKHFSDLAVIHMDAHADLRTEYEGETLSHATPLRKIAELIGPENVIQLGIRSGTREEFEYAASSGIRFHPFEVLKPLVEELPALAGRPVYVTVDIDVLGPAFAPGTGTPEPAGITSRELMESLHAIARSEVKVVGADLVEVAPAYDPTDQTAVAAAKMVREMLLGFVPA